jgi:ubiquinone/menaquinone biosynthesis C-methylase UbiE
MIAHEIRHVGSTPGLVAATDLALESPACDLCGHTEHRVLLPVRDRRHGGPGEFKLVECTRCALRYLSPRPLASTISAWYPDRYKAYKKKSVRLERIDDVLDAIWKSYLRVFLSGTYPIFYYPRHAAELATPGRAPRLLDVGCGSGDKLRYIRRRSDWQTYGVDFSVQAVENANARGAGDVRLTKGDALPFEDSFFDAVMSWHSLEHHYSPKATMQEVARVLRPGGYGIFAVPSGNNAGLRMFGRYWGPLEAPRHLYHFTAETLTRLFDEVGLKIHKVYYDFSFYGLFLEEEIFESLESVIRERTGWLRYVLQLPFKLLRVGGWVSSAATLPILPFNPVLGRLWRGTNLIVHFRKS